MLGKKQYELILLEKCCFILLGTCSKNLDKTNQVLAGRGSNGTFLSTQTRMIYSHHADGLSETAETANVLKRGKHSHYGVWWKENYDLGVRHTRVESWFFYYKLSNQGQVVAFSKCQGFFTYNSTGFPELWPRVLRPKWASEAPEGLLNRRRWALLLEFSDSIRLERGWESAFLTSSQVPLLLLVQRPHFERCRLSGVSEMKHSKSIINRSDDDGGEDNDENSWVITPLSHMTF